ncbi:DUF3180 family protein [Modestobacter sp. I12A-02628]|uniref:DUF3180 family protein n=1 Tax=Goekera deserti TaxID=2497753 RepID=A0A7K3WJ13_9ACTN|nr:DUF3180 domain-containing protein [Goekera deserti]MPQ98165.1 DUF3180 family protein [Goekera deserti]NDI48814.1 DUF3180 family protein [Goekera deserti]NEL56495.1 DUF3180 family protein [Goekera deserti]
MKPLRRRELVALGAVVALLSWLLVRRFYGDLPALDWWLPVPVGALAVAEALGARTLSQRLAEERAARGAARGEASAARGSEAAARTAAAGGPAPLARRVEPMLVARLAVLAQASAVTAAAIAGLWLGVLLHTVSELSRLAAAPGDARTAVVGAVLALALAASALYLERICRVPD